ncbi:hypothetical protein B0T25DRAFT_206426 [Lasiosphaeria hispida]|uniref:Uncharacterized protein n=1 Tax=Lasiosphaeria hispida TaxID=260671 RepID=A0AAJ0ME87_9PEZI|nr:hypothetical protein B0T25DRAFT_206426 [Lasiosphaeria hispida]
MDDTPPLESCLGDGHRKLRSMNIGSVSCEHMDHWQTYINRLIEEGKIWGKPCSVCLIDIIMWHRCKPSLLDVELLQTAPEMLIQAVIKKCVHAVAEGMRLLSNAQVPLQTSEPGRRTHPKDDHDFVATPNTRQTDDIPVPRQSPIARQPNNSSVLPTGESVSTSAHFDAQFESRYPSVEQLDHLLSSTSNQSAPRQPSPNTPSYYPPLSRANCPSRSTSTSPFASHPSFASQRGRRESSNSRGQQQVSSSQSSPTSAGHSSQPTRRLARAFNTAGSPFPFSTRPPISPETTPQPPSWNYVIASDADGETVCPPTSQTHIHLSSNSHRQTNTSLIHTAATPTQSHSHRDTTSNHGPRKPPLTFNVQVSQNTPPRVSTSDISDNRADQPVELQVYLDRPPREVARGEEHRAYTAHHGDSRRRQHRRASATIHDGKRGNCYQDNSTSNESVSSHVSSDALGFSSGRKKGSDEVARLSAHKNGRGAKGDERRCGSDGRRENGKGLYGVSSKVRERGGARKGGRRLEHPSSSGCDYISRERTRSVSRSGSIFRALVCFA